MEENRWIVTETKKTVDAVTPCQLVTNLVSSIVYTPAKDAEWPVKVNIGVLDSI